MNSILNKFINSLILKQLSPKTTSNWRQLSSNSPSKTSSTVSSDSESDIESIYDFERKFEDLSVESFKDLINDKSSEEKIELILSEYEYEKYTTLRVPTTLTIPQMKDILSLNDSLDRKQWFYYLFRRELARNKSNEDRKRHSEEYWKQKKELYNASKAERTGIWDRDHKLVYGLWHNTLFSKIMINAVKRYYSHRLRTTALFGPKLVIDLDYDKYMKLGECRQLAKQIHLLYNWNRYKSQEPFDLHFTNCAPHLPTVQSLQKLLPNHSSPHFMAEFHQKSYTELFSNEKLVYLSPHSDQTLKHFNCDDIYIIGGIIDKSYHDPLSYIKAKKDGIRCVRLPIDEHIIWKTGSKSLCLNHIIQILHDVNVGHNWSQALKDNIPQRKQKTVQEIEFEDTIRKQKLNRMRKSMKFDPKNANNYF